jgi:hypothetical protein
MKCPKCSYISFDFNQVCPKCNKDISAEQAKLNIPSFRPETPAFLGVLTGEAEDSGAAIQIDTGEHGMDVGADEIELYESGEMEFEEGEDLDFGLEGEEMEGISTLDSSEMKAPAQEPEIAPEDSVVSDFELEGDEEEFALEAEDLPADEAAVEPGLEEEELGIDLDSLDSAADDISPEADLGVEQEEVSLDLDDIKLDDSGEMSMDEAALSPEEADVGTEAEEISLEEPALEGETLKEGEGEGEELEIDLEGITRDAKKASEISEDAEDLSLDLDDLDLELDLDEPEDKQS